MAERTNADIKKQRLENIKRASGVNTDSGSVKRDYANHASTEDNKSSFTVYDDISVSDATNIQAEEQAENQTSNQEANPGQKHKRSSGSDFLAKNGTIKQYNTSAEMLGALTGVSVDKSPGTIGGIVNHRPDAKPMTAAQQLAAIESIVTSDSYAKALKNNAATTMQQIKRLQRKQQELTKQVEYASLTEGQLDDYSFRYDKYERRIQQLKTQYSQYEMKYMRQTGRDFKGNHSHNVVDVAMRDVKANRDYVDSLRFQIQQFENLSASSDNAEQSKELILNKKRKELESANALLKTSEERVLEMQDWQNSAEGKRKIARWEKQEARQAKRELAAKSGLRGAINKKIDSAETLVAKPFERPRKAINKAIDKVEYGLASPFRAANKVMDSAYSKAYEGLMRSKTKNAVDSAFSSVGNAAKKAAGNAKSTVANAAKAAAKAVFEMFKKAIMFLLTNPIGWAIDILLIIVLLITGGSSGGQVATEEEIAQGDERYSSETVYRRFIQEVELDLMEFATEYRVGLSSANVSSLLYASVDPDVFEKMTEENYVEKIDELLKGEKAEYAAKTFLKQVGYKFYYLYVQWSPWTETDNEVGVDPEPEFDEIDTYEKEVEVEYEVTDYDACGIAPDAAYYPGGYSSAEYQAAARSYNSCVLNPPSKTETKMETKTFYKGRVVEDYEWSLSGLDHPGKSPEQPRDTLRVTVEDFISETDKDDRGTWVWFNPDDGKAQPDRYNGYFIRKEKYWQIWSFEELSELLADNYNVVSNDEALVQPDGFDNFHHRGNIIELYDIEGNKQYDSAGKEVIVDMDKFYELMNQDTQYSFYDYVTSENEREPEAVAEQLQFMQTVMIHYGGSLFVDHGALMSPEEYAAFMEMIENLSNVDLADIDSTDIKRMLLYAEQFKGTPYRLGTQGPNLFDCSGFVYWVVNNCGNGWHVPRLTTYGMVNSPYYTEVPASQAQPGDIILIDWGNRGGDWSHVGIYMGNNVVIHTGGNPDGVSYQYLNNPGYSHWYSCPKKFMRLTSAATGG